MSDILPTVKVVAPGGGYMIINESDVRPDHKMWAEAETETETVDIPDDWRDLHWRRKGVLAERLTGLKYVNGTDAEAAIEAEMERRDAV